MKSLELFLSKIVRDCVRQEYASCQFLFLSKTGRTKLKLLPYKGDEAVMPHAEVFIHFVPSESGQSVGVTCHGKKCEICKIVKENQDLVTLRVSPRTLFYCEHEGDLKILITPHSFKKAVYGDMGLASEVVKKLRDGVNVFSLDQGREIEVIRDSVGSLQDFFIQILDQKTTSERIRGQLKTATRLEDVFKTLNQHDMKYLATKLLTGGKFAASDYMKVS